MNLTDLKEIEAIHPVYGSFIYNKAYPVKIYDKKHKNIIEYKSYKIYICNDIENPFYLYSEFMQAIIKFKPNKRYTLFNNGLKDTDLQIHNIMLSSVFYDYILQDEYIKNNDTIEIDHIDDDATNDLIENLQILSSYDNRKKGQEKSIKICKEKGGRNGKKIMLTKLNKKNKEYEDLKEFQSIGALATYMINNGLSLPSTSYKKLTSFFGEIINKTGNRSSYNKKLYSAYKIEIENIDTEIWQPIPRILYYNHDKKRQYFVSNKGRVKNLFGNLMNYNNDRYDKYREVQLNTKHYFIHLLVYVSFNPEDLYKINFSFNKKNKTEDEIKEMNLLNIGHDDNAPKHIINGKEYYRNYLEDLYLTTQSDNMKDWHQNKDNDRENIIIDNDREKFENKELINEIVENISNKVIIHKDTLDYYMNNPPMFIQMFQETDKRGFKYSLSKKLTIHNLNLIGSKYISRKAKFLQAYYAYSKFKNNNKVILDFDKLVEELDEIEKCQYQELKADIDTKLEDKKFSLYLL